MTDTLLAALDVGPADRVIELAPGMGVTARALLARRPASFIAVDIDAGPVTATRAVVEPARGQVVIGPAQHVPLPDHAASDAIRRRLNAGGALLYRYPPGSDGLAGGEGAFLPCSFWLVHALARTGRHGAADAMFDALLTLGGPLGLFGEEMDPATGEHLGNFPQALTHAALVQAALALSDTNTSGARRA